MYYLHFTLTLKVNCYELPLHCVCMNLIYHCWDGLIEGGQSCSSESTPQLLWRMTSRLTSWLNPGSLFCQPAPNIIPRLRLHLLTSAVGVPKPMQPAGQGESSCHPGMMSRQPRNDVGLRQWNGCEMMQCSSRFMCGKPARAYCLHTGHTHPHPQSEIDHPKPIQGFPSETTGVT